MAPGLTRQNTVYSRFANAIFSRKLASTKNIGPVKISDFFNFFRAKFGIYIISTIGVNRECLSLSSFSNHVLHIVMLGTKKKMIRINAFRIVTFVKNTLRVVKRSILNRIGDPVGFMRIVIDRKSPVSMFVLARLPYPTCFSFFHLFPESRGEFIFHNHIV